MEDLVAMVIDELELRTLNNSLEDAVQLKTAELMRTKMRRKARLALNQNSWPV